MSVSAPRRPEGGRFHRRGADKQEGVSCGKEVFYLNSVADVWRNVLKEMGNDLSPTTISTWFDETEAVDIQDNRLLLHCGNDFKKGYIESLFLKNVKAALKNLFSMDFEVKILDDEEYSAWKGPAEAVEEPKPAGRIPMDEFTFDTFVVGPSNKLAYAASVSVANSPARHYNPLLIYGDSGLGKTHLIYAIANVIRKTIPNAKITYNKGDDMTNELVAAIQDGKTGEMREKYRKADLLLVDDVQFIAGKKQTQEEFFHTFNTLYEAGKQIVLTSDRPPSEMTMLEDRLRTRFEWGLLVDVQPPDFETRIAIAKRKAASRGMTLPDTVAAVIAENVTANVRQLEGMVNRVLAYKELLDNDVDQATVRRALSDIFKNNTEAPSTDTILKYVCAHFDVDQATLRGTQRNRGVAQARHVAIYMIRNMTNLSQDDIGKLFGGRDHTTIMHSLRLVEQRLKTDKAFAETIKELKTNISTGR